MVRGKVVNLIAPRFFIYISKRCVVQSEESLTTPLISFSFLFYCALLFPASSKGDNSNQSLDSREYGPVPMGLISGRAFTKIWSNANIRSIGLLYNREGEGSSKWSEEGSQVVRVGNKKGKKFCGLGGFGA